MPFIYCPHYPVFDDFYEQELATLQASFEEQRAKNESLKKMKVTLPSSSSMNAFDSFKNESFKDVDVSKPRFSTCP